MKTFTIAILLLVINLPNELKGQVSADPKKFNQLIERKLDSLYSEVDDFAGATIGIVLPDGQQFSFAVGLSDIEKNIKMIPGNRMLGGSTGKIFVSASIMQLVATENIDLDEKMTTYLKEVNWIHRVQNSDQITIRNLMQHSTGISRYVFEEEFQEELKIDADRIWQPAELISFVLDKEPLFPAGTSFAYSDTNYILLAMVLEEVSGRSMYDYVRENILEPFELSSISPQITRKISGLASGYSSLEDPFFAGKTAEDGEYKFNLQFEWAGGGFIVNSTDLAKAGKLIYEGKIFRESLLDEYFIGIEAGRLGGHWGLGVHMRETPMGLSYGHSGFFPGYITNMLYFPKDGFAIAFQVNTSDGSKMSLYRKLYQLIPDVQGYLQH